MDKVKGKHPTRQVLAENAKWAAGSLWLAAVLWAFVNGPRLHELREQTAVVEEEAENHTVCERLGMPSGSPAYPACASELGLVRRQQRQRMEPQAVDLL